MRRNRISAILLISTTLLISSIFAQSGETNAATAVRAVSKSNTQFTSNLYDALKENFPGNLIFSGFSISTIMGMIKAGARGITEKEIQTGLNFPRDEELYEGYNALLESLQSNENFTLEAANRVYSATGFSLNPAYLKIVHEKFHAEAEQLNFGNGVESADKINAFVEDVTRNKIKNLISAGDLDAMTRLVLVNAIYFKGKWKNRFDPKATQKSKFYVTPENPVDVDMMRIEADFPYAEIQELNAKAIALPYLGDRLAMVILLPNAKDGLKDMEAKLKNYDLSLLPEKLTERKVALQLPRFKLESTIDLKEPLSKLGLKSMFDPIEADFTGMPSEPLSSNDNLYVSKAIQKAFIEVNEEGSEAAAATGIQIQVKSAFLPKSIKIEHPFLSYIYDESSKLSLFTTTLSDPTKTQSEFVAAGSGEGRHSAKAVNQQQTPNSTGPLIHNSGSWLSIMIMILLSVILQF